MNTYIIIITHANTASAFVSAIQNMNIAIPTQQLLFFDVHNTSDPDAITQQIDQNIKQLTNLPENKSGTQSYLLITDLIGSTPYNITTNIHKILREKNKLSALVSGINLPMLLKTLNYIALPADQLASKICQTGQECIQFIIE